MKNKHDLKTFVVKDSMITLKALYKQGQANTGYAFFIELLILQTA